MAWDTPLRLMEPVAIPATPNTVLRSAIGKADGSDPGDGILFRIAVVDSTGAETVVAERTWIEHAWTPLEADLARWAGQSIQLKLICDVGTTDNSSGDWACWSQLRLESREPVLTTTLHTQRVELCREPGPYDRADLTRDALRSAKRATLHFRGIGLQHDDRYITTGRLNGVSLGELPAATGQAGEDPWSAVSLDLTPEALATLDQWNELTLQNPHLDSFKVRGFWLEIELADGRRVSSHVTKTVVSQPDTWAHAEGQGVPFGTEIRAAVRIPLADQK